MKLNRAQLGKWGEEVAHSYLVSKGYAVKETNWRMHNYELDIVIQEGKELVFVEVKTRRHGEEDPIVAVDRRKRAHMIASADAFMNQEKYRNKAYEYRFDIVGITGDPDDYEIEHIIDAFLPSL